MQEALKEEQVRIIEEGQNGRTTVWDDPIEGMKSGLKYLIPCLESHSPLDVVVLMLGTNDIKQRFSLSASDVAAGAETLVKTIKMYFRENREPVPEILLVSPLKIREEIVNHKFSPMFGGERAVKISGELAGYYRETAKRQGCAFLDAASVTMPGAEDSVHLDPEGHRVFAEAVTEKLREILRERKEIN